jgi:cell division protein FtsN
LETTFKQFACGGIPLKNVTPSSGKALFIVLIALVIAILLAAGAGFYFKKTAFSTKPDPQPVVTRHKISSTPDRPGDKGVVATPQTVDSETQAAIPGDLDSNSSAPIITPVADDEHSVQTETAQAKPPAPDGAVEGKEQPLVVPAPGTATDTEAMDAQASAANGLKQPTGAENTSLQMPASSSQPVDERPMAAAPVVSPSEETVYYAIQVGAFRSKDNARRNVAELLKKGYAAFIIETRDAKSQTWYFSRFGRYASKSQAQASLAEFKQKEKKPAFIMPSDQ